MSSKVVLNSISTLTLAGILAVGCHTAPVKDLAVVNTPAKDTTKPPVVNVKKEKTKPIVTIRLLPYCRVNVALINNSPDTIKYVGWSCSGSEILRLNTDKIALDPGIECNASWPVKCEILPHDSNIYVLSLYLNKDGLGAVTKKQLQGLRVGLPFVSADTIKWGKDNRTASLEIEREVITKLQDKNIIIWSNELVIGSN